MSNSNGNIAKTLVDCLGDVLINTGGLVGTLTKPFWLWLFDGWIKDKKDMNMFFESTGSKNKLGEYPAVVKNIDDKHYILKAPVGMNIDDFEKTRKSLEAYLNSNVDIELKNGYLKISKVNKQLQDTIPYSKQKRNSNYIKFDIGRSLKKAITLDLKENPHSYVVGTTGSGKSVMTKVILTSIVDMFSHKELELYLCDLKMVELALFRNLKHTKKFVYTVEDTTEVIADLLEETKRRYNLFMENEVTDIFEYNKLKGVEKLKYQVLYIEEIVILLEDKTKSAMKLLKQLIAISRASGCYVFLTTQRPDNTIIDNVVKANINNRIVLKCEDSKNSVVALDKEGAENLRGNGHGIIKRGSNMEEFQGYFISNDEVKQIINPYLKPKQDKKENQVNEQVKEENKTTHNPNLKVIKNKKDDEVKEELKQVAVTKDNIDLSFLDKI